VGDDEDDVCIVCQSAFEGVAPGVKFPGDECPVVVSLMFFVGSSFCENVDSESELLTLTMHEILDIVGEVRTCVSFAMCVDVASKSK
jgi:hypothetical protein